MFTKCQQNMRMRDFQVQCPAKTLRARGATSKTMQIRQKCTVLFPIETRDSSFFFDALFFLIPTGCFFSALFSKYIALFFFWYFATWTRCIGNCDTTCCVPSCFCFGTNEKFKIVWCGNSMGLNFVRLE